MSGEAQLGLATTEELLRELIARFTIPLDYGGVERGLILAEMIGSLGATAREYRTVDGD